MDQPPFGQWNETPQKTFVTIPLLPKGYKKKDNRKLPPIQDVQKPHDRFTKSVSPQPQNFSKAKKVALSPLSDPTAKKRLNQKSPIKDLVLYKHPCMASLPENHMSELLKLQENLKYLPNNQLPPVLRDHLASESITKLPLLSQRLQEAWPGAAIRSNAIVTDDYNSIDAKSNRPVILLGKRFPLVPPTKFHPVLQSHRNDLAHNMYMLNRSQRKIGRSLHDLHVSLDNIERRMKRRAKDIKGSLRVKDKEAVGGKVPFSQKEKNAHIANKEGTIDSNDSATRAQWETEIIKVTVRKKDQKVVSFKAEKQEDQFGRWEVIDDP